MRVHMSTQNWTQFQMLLCAGTLIRSLDLGCWLLLTKNRTSEVEQPRSTHGSVLALALRRLFPAWSTFLTSMEFTHKFSPICSNWLAAVGSTAVIQEVSLAHSRVFPGLWNRSTSTLPPSPTLCYYYHQQEQNSCSLANSVG